MAFPADTAPASPTRRGLLALLVPGVTLGALLPAFARVPGYETLGQVFQGLASDPPVVERFEGGVIDIVFADGAPGLDRDRARRWVRASAEAVTSYLGHFPVAAASILIVAQDGARVGRATAWGYRGSTIRIGVGRDTDDAAYGRDWVLVHEMMHLALPSLPENQAWAVEGSATYAEPVARAQLGRLPLAKLWADLIRGTPQGLPEAGDRGLDNTSTWGRTYWGGAVFFLLADVRIRQATGNARGLQDAFGAISRASGGNQASWTMAQFAAVGDRATGTDVLASLYAEMRATPVSIDLPALFGQLGVSQGASGVIFDDAAPLAAIRRAMTAPPAPAVSPATR